MTTFGRLLACSEVEAEGDEEDEVDGDEIDEEDDDEDDDEAARICLLSPPRVELPSLSLMATPFGLESTNENFVQRN